MGGFLHGVVAVTAVHPKLTSVQLVAERYGLYGRITHVRKLGRKPVPNTKDCKGTPEGCKNKQRQGQSVGPTRKDDGHGLLPLSV